MAEKKNNVLELNGIRLTNCRSDIWNYFLKKKTALTFPELEKALKKHDRTTVFRNLVFFDEQGLIHKFNDAQGIVKYALCKADCAGHQHQDNHIHFTCDSCHSTYCLNEKHSPKITVPKKYKLETYSITASGLCDNCQ